MTAPVPKRAVDNAKRNAVIITALCKWGTKASAAREAGCDPRTVTRLIQTNDAAAQAFSVGVAALHARRISKYRSRLDKAQHALDRTEAQIEKHRQQIVDGFGDMTLSTVQSTERAIEELLLRRGRQKTAVKQIQKKLDYAEWRSQLAVAESEGAA